MAIFRKGVLAKPLNLPWLHPWAMNSTLNSKLLFLIFVISYVCKQQHVSSILLAKVMPTQQDAEIPPVLLPVAFLWCRHFDQFSCLPFKIQLLVVFWGWKKCHLDICSTYDSYGFGKPRQSWKLCINLIIVLLCYHKKNLYLFFRSTVWSWYWS